MNDRHDTAAAGQHTGIAFPWLGDSGRSRWDPETDVSGDDPIVTGKIALAHLTEFPDYYTRLAVLEREAGDHKSERK